MLSARHSAFRFAAIAGAPFSLQSGTAANEDWIAIQLATVFTYMQCMNNVEHVVLPLSCARLDPG